MLYVNQLSTHLLRLRCTGCVATWRENSRRCPLCSVSGRMGEIFEDDLTNIFCIEREPNIVAIDEAEATDDSAGDFEDLPSFSTPRSQ